MLKQEKVLDSNPSLQLPMIPLSYEKCGFIKTDQILEVEFGRPVRDSLFQLYYEVDGVIGLARKGNLEKIKRAFINSYKVVTAWDGDTIVGAGRMISDGECYGWIHDMGVLPAHQKKGIGKSIINELMNENEKLLFGLTAAFGTEDFYLNLGFKKHKTAMAKYPGKSIYLEY